MVPRAGASGEKSTMSRRGGPREEEGRRRETAEAGTGLRQREGMEDRGLGGGEEPLHRAGDTGDRKRGGRKGTRRRRGVRSQLWSTPAARRPVTRAVVVGSIPSSSARGAHLKTSIVQRSGRQYSCNRSSSGHRSTQTPPDAGMFLRYVQCGQQDVQGRLDADGEGNKKGQWRRGMLMCTQETHNERDRRRGRREEQGVS